MRFPDWVKQQPVGVLKKIERATGIGYNVLQRARRGEPISGRSALAISNATAGDDGVPAVSVEELINPPPSENLGSSESGEHPAVSEHAPEPAA